MRYAWWLSVLLLAGCASGLPYKPTTGDAPVSASHQLASDRLYVQLDTEGYRVESAQLVLASGVQITPETVHHPARGRGSSAGDDRSYGNTVVLFPATRVGPGPWVIRVKLTHFPAVEIALPAIKAKQ